MPASEAPSPPLPTPAPAVEQSPRAAAKPEAAPTRQPQGTNGPRACETVPATGRCHAAEAGRKAAESTKAQTGSLRRPRGSRSCANAPAGDAPGPAREAAGQGAAAGSSGASQASRANYGAILSPRSRVIRSIPRPRGRRGEWFRWVVLTVGPDGQDRQPRDRRSSGNSAIDREVHAMMAAVQAPPPPDGVFRTGVTIRFNLQ